MTLHISYKSVSLRVALMHALSVYTVKTVTIFRQITETNSG